MRLVMEVPGNEAGHGRGLGMRLGMGEAWECGCSWAGPRNEAGHGRGLGMRLVMEGPGNEAGHGRGLGMRLVMGGACRLGTGLRMRLGM